MTRTISIQSYCYRHFKSLPALVEQIRATGLGSLELCRVHADFLDRSVHASVIEQFRRADIAIVAIGVEYLSGELEKDRPRFEFCKAAGVRHMSFSFQPDSMWEGLRNIERLAEQYDITLGIHNHGGYDWLGNPTILKYIFDKTGPRIGLYLDTAWAIDAKQNAVQMAETFGDRLRGVHLKDFIYNRAREPKDVIIGTGNLGLPKFMQTLDQIKFAGPLVIEYEGDIEDPVPALRQCVSALKQSMS